MSLFVDTSIWFAVADATDRDNRRAKTALSTSEAPIVTDHVLVESWLLIHHRLGKWAADKFWDGIRRGVALIEPVGPADLEAAWQIGIDWPDQDFSIVDRTSFAVMNRLGMDRAASLDRHFSVYRFGPRRRHAFTVLP